MAKASKKKTSKKNAAKKKSARKKTTARKKKTSSRKAAPKTTIEKLSGNVKKLMLANLGLYGQVLDELQSQAARASDAIKAARKDPAQANQQLIKRGEQLADEIRDMLKRSGAPATKQLEKQLRELRENATKLRKRLQR